MSNKAAAALGTGLLLVGLLIGRASANDGGPSTAKPKAEQTTSTGLDPKNYPRTKEGAATAAQAYNDAFMGAVLMTPEQRRGVVESISSDAMRAEIRKTTDEAAETLTKLLDLPKDAAQVVRRVSPLGWRVMSFTKDSARVELWTVAVFGKPGVGNGITPIFKTATYDLAWERGAWRLAGTPQSKDGPTPVADNPQASSELLNATEDLEEFSHVAAR